MNKFSILSSTALAGVLLVAPAIPAHALQDDEISDVIVVTATKREAALQDVPFSINAQTEADIQRTGADSIEDIARNVAGLTIQNLGPGQSQVSIRGVSAGQIVRDQPGVKEQVGVYLDESVISLSLFTPDFDLYDLNRVETLRGPQGTLFGSGSIGGTIRYITNEPVIGLHEASAEAEVNTVEDGGVGGHLKGMTNIPLGDTAALRIVGYHTEYAGFIDALGEGGSRTEDVNSGQRTGIRATMAIELGDNVTVTPRIVYQDLETDGFNRQERFNLYANPYTTTRPAITLGPREQYLLLREGFTDETMLADMTVDIGFDGFDFTSVTSFMDRDILVSRDASALTGSVSVDLGFPDAGVMLPSNLRDTTDLQQVTQELRVASNGTGPVDWIFGIFWSEVERDYAQRLPTPGYDAFTDAAFGAGTSAALANGFPLNSPYNADLSYTLKQTAVFGEATWYATERLALTAGGRWYDFEEERTISQGGLFSSGFDNVMDTTASDGFSPRLIASYDLNDTVTLNAQASQGFRLGGVNDPLNSTLCTPEDEAIFGGFQDYDDETLWNYEAGLKAQRGGVTFNAAVFHNDIEDLQVTLDAGSCSSRVSFNVPEAHTTGIELEYSHQLTSNLFVSFAGTVLEAEFDSTVVDGTGAVLGGVREGNRLASTPEVMVSASALYTFDAPWAGNNAEGFFSASYQHVGSQYTQPSDQEAGAGVFTSGLPFGGATGAEPTWMDLELDPYGIGYLSAGLDWGDMQLTVFVDNVLDENANLSFDRERGGRARLSYRTNQPRTIGINLRKQY
jgi:iron complex outermembrane receptor protein